MLLEASQDKDKSVVGERTLACASVLRPTAQQPSAPLPAWRGMPTDFVVTEGGPSSSIGLPSSWLTLRAATRCLAASASGCAPSRSKAIAAALSSSSAALRSPGQSLLGTTASRRSICSLARRRNGAATGAAWRLAFDHTGKNDVGAELRPCEYLSPHRALKPPPPPSVTSRGSRYL